MMAREDFLPPILHHRQMLPDNVRLPVTNYITVTRMWDSQDSKAATIIEEIVMQEMQRLFSQV
jgi:hypothetical protein